MWKRTKSWSSTSSLFSSWAYLLATPTQLSRPADPSKEHPQLLVRDDRHRGSTPCHSQKAHLFHRPSLYYADHNQPDSFLHLFCRISEHLVLVLLTVEFFLSHSKNKRIYEWRLSLEIGLLPTQVASLWERYFGFLSQLIFLAPLGERTECTSGILTGRPLLLAHLTIGI